MTESEIEDWYNGPPLQVKPSNKFFKDSKDSLKIWKRDYRN